MSFALFVCLTMMTKSESDLNDQQAGRPRHIPSNGMHPGA